MLARLLALLATVTTLLVFAAQAPASISGTNTFTGGSLAAPTDWNDPANWSQGEVPDGADDVVIPSGRVVSLSSGASGVARTLNDAGSLTIDGGGIAGGRSLTVGSGSSTIASTLSVFNGAVLNLGTTTDWTAGTVGVGGTGGATVNIGAGDVLNVTGNVSSSNWGSGLWNNQGTINRTTGTGTASFNNAVENDGAVNVSAGKLSLQQGDGAGTSSGTYNAGAGATLEFFGGSFDLAGATAGVGGAGTVEDYAATVAVGAGATFTPGALGLTGWGTLQLDTPGTTGSLNAVGGTRTGSGTLTVNGPMSVGSSGVVFKGTGTTTVTGTSTINASTFNVQDGHTLNLGTTTTWNTGTVGVGGTGGATVNIGAGDVLNVTGDVSSGNWGSGLWNNQGTINRTTGTGTASFDNAVENDGAINVGSGTLALHQGDGAGTSAGTYSAAAGATLTFSGGNHELTGSAAVTGAGTIRFGGGTVAVGAGATFTPAALDFAGGTLQLDTAGSAGSLTASGGSRTGTGALSVSGAMSVSQVFTLKGTGTTTVGGTTTLDGTALYALDGHTLNLGTTTNWSTGIVGVGGTGEATVNVGAGDVLNITGDVNSQGSGGGHWTNAGTINRTTSSGTATFFKPVTSSGTINVHAGTLTFDSGLTQTAGTTSIASGTTLGGAVALQGGLLKGTGSAAGSIANTGGTVAPGASPGKLTVGGDYSQSGGTLEVQIAGTGQGTTYDWLAVTGNVAITGGTLAILTDPQFDPAPSDTFDIVTAGSTQTASGSGFANVTGAALPGRSYAVHIVAGPPGKVTLGFTSAPQNAAAPSIPASAHAGDPIACDPGTWSGSPTGFTFQWLRDGAVIAGATSDHYVLTSDDVGASITCRVTATNGAGSTEATSNPLVPAAAPTPTPTPAPEPGPSPSTTPPPGSVDQTVRGDAAFTEGASNDLYLACTKLDLLLIDVLPAGRRTVSVTGTADLRLVGQTADILLDGRRVGHAAIGADGSFAATVAAPPPGRRMHARYQARVGATASQRLRLARRMVATTLTRDGSSLVLRGRITGPFAARPAAITVERFLSCRRRTKVAVLDVMPDRSGNFAVRVAVPTGAKAAIYRALTSVASRPRGNPTVHTFTLPRAIDL